MRVLGLDTETTGIDPLSDEVIEIGGCVWDTDRHCALHVFNHTVYEDGRKAIPKEATEIHGISNEDLKEFGISPFEAFSSVNNLIVRHNIEMLVAHNAHAFDKVIINTELRRLSLDGISLTKLPWLDTRFDLPFDKQPDSMRLKHLACDIGVINHFSHRALTDVLTMMMVFDRFPVQKIIEYSKIPSIVVRAMVNYDERQQAKDKRFSWERIDDKVYKQCWVKKIKANMFDALKKECSFKLALIDTLS